MPTFPLLLFMLFYGVSLIVAAAVGAWLTHAATKSTSPLAPVRDAVRAVRSAFEKPEKVEPGKPLPNPRM
jgi:hypothetical protein